MKDKVQIEKVLATSGLLDALLPAAMRASELRACGIRLVASPEAMEVLQGMAMASSDDKIAVIAGNLFPQGYPEVQ